jgi:hypothetical protein
MVSLSPVTRRQLEIQGFCGVEERTLAQTAPWLRLALALCTALAAAGTVLASPIVLWSLVAIAALAAALPVHPFDLLYDFGVRHWTGTAPLPRRGAPSRFACGLGAAWLMATGWAFHAGATTTGYVLGALLTLVGLLVSTTDICIPSLLFRTCFGFPPKSADGRTS